MKFYYNDDIYTRNPLDGKHNDDGEPVEHVVHGGASEGLAKLVPVMLNLANSRA